MTPLPVSVPGYVTRDLLLKPKDMSAAKGTDFSSTRRSVYRSKCGFGSIGIDSTTFI